MVRSNNGEVPAVGCEVVQVGTRTVAHLTGELAVSTAPAVRMALAKCLVEQPQTLVVNVAGLTVTEPAAVSVFLAVAQQAAMWPGTPLLLCSPDPALASALAAGYGRLRVFPTVALALAAPPGRRLASISDLILPTSAASRQARLVAGEACRRWELPHLADSAALVAGELVSNAAEHAGTMADLRLSLGRRYLMIAVRDGSRATPRMSTAPLGDPSAGRGLLLVSTMAHRWGSLPADNGKVVWATLPLAAR
jgi:anti-anti-sigma regulatory factor